MPPPTRGERLESGLKEPKTGPYFWFWAHLWMPTITLLIVIAAIVVLFFRTCS